MSKLKVLIRDDIFLWKPISREDDKIEVEGPYCLKCRVELQEKIRCLDPYSEPDEVSAYCVKCVREIEIGTNYSFDNLREAARLRIASKNLRDYKVVSLDDL